MTQADEKQQTPRFGLDRKTGRLMIAGRAIPLPRSRSGRIALGTGFILGGTLGFLPILGFWMLPLGFVVLSQDVPFVQRQMDRLDRWWSRRRKRKT